MVDINWLNILIVFSFLVKSHAHTKISLDKYYNLHHYYFIKHMYIYLILQLFFIKYLPVYILIHFIRVSTSSYKIMLTKLFVQNHTNKTC